MNRLLVVILLAFQLFQLQAQTSNLTPKEEQNKMEFNFLFIEACKQKMLGRYNEALELYGQCNTIDPENSACMYEIARILYNYKDVRGAINYMEKAFKISSDNVWYGLFLSDLYKKSGNYSDAIDVFKTLIKTQDDNLVFFYDLVAVYVHTKNYKGAEKTYKLIEKKFGYNEVLAQEKIKFYLQTTNKSKAVDATQRAIKTFANNLPYRNILAEIYIQTGKLDEALAIYNQLIDKGYNIVQNKIDRSFIYKIQNDTANYELSVRSILNDKLIPPASKLDFYLSIYSSDYKDYFKPYEEEFIFTIYNLHPNEVMVNLAMSDFLINNEREEEALQYLYFVLENDKTNYVVFEEIIRIESSMLNWEKVYSTSSEALKLYPNQPYLFFYNGFSAMQLEKYTEAIEMFKRGIPLSTNDKLTIEYYMYIAECNYKLEQKDEAFGYFDKALKMDYKNALILNNYSYYLSLDSTNLDQALEMTKISNELEPNNPLYLDTYAWVLYKMKRYNEAKEKIEEAIKYSDDMSGEVLEHYGDILYQLSEIDKAVEQWKRAKQSGDASDVISDKIENKQLIDN